MLKTIEFDAKTTLQLDTEVPNNNKIVVSFRDDLHSWELARYVSNLKSELAETVQEAIDMKARRLQDLKQEVKSLAEGKVQ